MTAKRALQIILGISVFGVLFSGTLTYREFFGQSAATCPSPGPAGTILGYPACVYGFVMYVLISTIASWGLFSARKPTEEQRPSAPAQRLEAS